MATTLFKLSAFFELSRPDDASSSDSDTESNQAALDSKDNIFNLIQSPDKRNRAQTAKSNIANDGGSIKQPNVDCERFEGVDIATVTPDALKAMLRQRRA